MTITRYIGPSILIGLLALIPASAFAASDINDSSLYSSGGKHTLTGTSNAKAVRIIIENEDGKKVYSSRDLKVKAGKWKGKISKKLPAGSYEVELYEKGKRDESTTETLVVGKGASLKGGALSVSMLPLLMGGTANSYASAPVAYVKIANTGSGTTTISGFTLAENGSASDSIVTGFSVNDDKGGSRATINATFVKGSVFVPLAATIAPGQIRIFTVKANLGSVAANNGKQLKIDVASVKTEASVKGMFPLRGTTFVLGN